MPNVETRLLTFGLAVYLGYGQLRAGMYWMILPRRVNPITINITPSIKVATCKPAIPHWVVIPANITMKAPVGPAISRQLPHYLNLMILPMKF